MTDDAEAYCEKLKETLEKIGRIDHAKCGY